MKLYTTQNGSYKIYIRIDVNLVVNTENNIKVQLSPKQIKDLEHGGFMPQWAEKILCGFGYKWRGIYLRRF